MSETRPKVMIIGSGGREHALAWGLKNRGKVGEVIVAPGNGGTHHMDGVRNMNLEDYQSIVEYARKEDIDLTVVGPEAPLADGLADLFWENKLPILGFKKKTATLESSKVWAKEFMSEYGIPTADFSVFTRYEEGVEHLKKGFNRDSSREFFIKADELCGGKGAIHAPTLAAGKEALKNLLIDKKCGRGEKVVIEEKLVGEEATILAFLDRFGNYRLMPAMQDHKPVYDKDQGPNTGGMGAYAPAPIVSSKIKHRIVNRIIEPTIYGMKEEDILDSGILYFGTLITKTGDPYLLEYNVRFGDPEAQPVLPLLDCDLYQILKSCQEGRLDQTKLEWKDASCVCVVLATSGYPIDYGDVREEIIGIDQAANLPGVMVFHAGTEFRDGKFYTAGGRILGVTGIDKSLKEATHRAYRAVEKIHFKEMHYRTDIAAKALSR